MNDGKERTLKTSGPTAWTAMDWREEKSCYFRVKEIDDSHLSLSRPSLEECVYLFHGSDAEHKDFPPTSGTLEF
jgi:hypothetical protein